MGKRVSLPSKEQVNLKMAVTKTSKAENNVQQKDAAIKQLNFYLEVLLAQVKGAVQRRRAVDDDPDNNFRGLYVTDKDAQRLLDGGWPPIFPAAPADDEPLLITALDGGMTYLPETPINRIRETFSLTDTEITLLIIALAPDMDRRFETLYGYLNDDVTKRRATIGLAFELAGLDPMDPSARASLADSSRLVDQGLILIEDGENPFLGRSLKVPDRVTANFLGDETPSPEILPFMDTFLYDCSGNYALPPSADGYIAEISSALRSGVDFIYLRVAHGSVGKEVGPAGLFAAGMKHISVDTLRFQKDTNYRLIADILGREALLTGAGLVIGPTDAITNTHQSFAIELIRLFTEQKVPVILYGQHSFDPRWSGKVALSIQLEHLDSGDRLVYWDQILTDQEISNNLKSGQVSFLDHPAAQRMSLEQIWRTSKAAKIYAASKQAKLDQTAMEYAIRSENTAGLEQFAVRIKPSVGFDDLVLPKNTVDLLDDLISRVRYRELVLGKWNMRAGAGRGRGISALFAGESGTGKTMSAEVIAKELGFELYTINLSTVVDKYIGETEKNLERIFIELDRVNAVLLFDEADAIFGKRSEVRDAHDRYANIEVAYLLQKLESFDGLALLSTNLRAGIDEAFTRRLDAVIEFPLPDKEQRLILWQRFFSKLPLADDIDFQFLAEQFELSGGNISSISLTAAYMAAGKQASLTMSDAVSAVHREYKKLGRLSVRQDFGKWLDILEKNK